MQGSPETQMSTRALGEQDLNVAAVPGGNVAPLKGPHAKPRDARFHSPTDSAMSPASQFVNNKKKGSKLRAGCQPSQLEGDFTQAAAAKPAPSSRFAPTSRFASQ
mmetsp:Transcript_17816/g.28423  ORF Transcript_17816/g.28423 Transcript_17816/m.28423 type:complete len:105 (-) Transcript_17816:464-778(-)